MTADLVFAEGLGKCFSLRPPGGARLWGRIRAAAGGARDGRSPDGLWALRGLDASVRAGEMFGIVGPNGSGKTTLLRLIAGIYAPSEGRLRVRARVSPFIQLGAALHEDLSVADNLRLCGALLGMNRRDLRERWDRMIAFAGLEACLDRPLGQLSTGYAGRVPFCVAIHSNLELVLVDEMLAVGDITFQEKCLESFLRLKAEGKTVIVATHDVPWVRERCDRALWLQGGTSRMLGTGEETALAYLEAYRAAPAPAEDAAPIAG